MMDKAVIISTGDELTTGRVIDTNSATIADRLSTVGIEVTAVLKVGDDRELLRWALDRASDISDLIVGTGGLGPTADDLTAEVVGQFLGCRLLQDEHVAQSLKKRFEARGLTWSDNNLKQARFPEGSVIIPNPTGTAPGFRVSVGPHRTLVWLSGVPQEMLTMLSATVMPWLADLRSGAEQISACSFKIYGLTESRIDDMLKSISLGQGAKLSFRAHFPDLTLRLTVRGKGERIAKFERLKSEIKKILGSYIYAEGEETLEEVVGRLLLAKHQTLALAESCTGGYISHRITRVAGSSVYFHGGVVSYSNEAKIRYLGVKAQTLQEFGAVSEQAALEMSAGVRDRLASSIGIGVTGIAGPSGGTAEKPVGTVWISIAGNNLHEARRFQFHGDRERVIVGTSQAALDWLRKSLRAP